MEFGMFGFRTGLYHLLTMGNLADQFTLSVEGGGAGGGGGFTEAQKQEIIDIITPTVNGTAKSMASRIESTLDKKLETFMTGLEKKIEPLVKPPEADPPPQGGKGSKNSKEDMEYAAFRREFESMKSEMGTMRQERDEAIRINREGEFRSKTIAALTEHGKVTNPLMAKAALTWLRDEGKIKMEEDGTAVWNDAGTAIPVELGLKSWAKTDEAKQFQPAVGMRGSGSRPVTALAPGQAPTAEQQMAMIGAALDGALG